MYCFRWCTYSGKKIWWMRSLCGTWWMRWLLDSLLLCAELEQWALRKVRGSDRILYPARTTVSVAQCFNLYKANCLILVNQQFLTCNTTVCLSFCTQPAIYTTPCCSTFYFFIPEGPYPHSLTLADSENIITSIKSGSLGSDCQWNANFPFPVLAREKINCNR